MVHLYFFSSAALRRMRGHSRRKVGTILRCYGDFFFFFVVVSEHGK